MAKQTTDETDPYVTCRKQTQLSMSYKEKRYRQQNNIIIIITIIITVNTFF